MSRGRLFRGWLAVSILVGFGAAGGFLFFLIGRGTVLFRNYPLLDFLLGRVWVPGKDYGALPFLSGSLLTVGIALSASLPVGLPGAAHMAFFGSPRGRGALRRILRAGTAVPSVVFGLFGLTVLRFGLRFVSATGFGPLSAGLTLGLMGLPALILQAEEAYREVPLSLLHASFALGADRMETFSRLVRRVARPGIRSAVLLTANRLLAESMAVEMLVGNAPVFPPRPDAPAATLTSQLVLEMGGSPPGSRWQAALFSLALLLLLISLTMNLVARARPGKGVR